MWQVGATIHCGARASHHRGLSCSEHRLQTRRLSNCGSRAQLLRSMWDLPRPGLKPVSPALIGRFSTTAPPGKPLSLFFFKGTFIYLLIGLCWVFVVACRLSLVVASGVYSSLWCVGFSLRWLLLLRSMGSRRAGFSSCGSQALEGRLSSCDARA